MIHLYAEDKTSTMEVEICHASEVHTHHYHHHNVGFIEWTIRRRCSYDVDD
jgi:hypothetical protein